MASTLRIWLALLDKLEFDLKVKVGRARNSFINGTAKHYESSDGGTPNFLVGSYQRQLTQLLEGHYRVVVDKFGNLALRSIKSRHLHTKAFNTSFKDLIDEWILTQGLLKARLISDTDMDLIRTAISEGVDEGEGVPAIASRIRKVTALTPARSALVARTETHSAATFGSITASRQAEDELGIVLLKRWLPTRDHRTRAAHIAMDGKPAIPLSEKFVVDGEHLDRPGDPSGSPENIINCRCALGYVEAEDEEP